LTAVVPISKQFLAQDSVGAENAIREEIINAINAKLEATILGAGAGDANTPAGIFNGELTSVSDFAALCDMEADIEDANVYGDLKYILAPKAKSALRNMAKSAKSTQLVYENGEVDGTMALSTSHVKDTNFAYGDFSQFIIAQWGALDIVVDNYTLASKGQVRLVVTAFFDAKALREEAIKVGKIVVA
jgi:HK97 family phage major capsid protein